jgi:hypothetical protein
MIARVLKNIMIETDFRESFSIGARTTLCCMDRQCEASRAFTAGRGPLRILYINSTSANGKQQKRTNRAQNAGFVAIEGDAGRSSSP